MFASSNLAERLELLRIIQLEPMGQGTKTTVAVQFMSGYIKLCRVEKTSRKTVRQAEDESDGLVPSFRQCRSRKGYQVSLKGHRINLKIVHI